MYRVWGHHYVFLHFFQKVEFLWLPVWFWQYNSIILVFELLKDSQCADGGGGGGGGVRGQ